MQREFHQPAKMEVLMGRFLGNDYGFTMVIYGK
jgi:hypothetical protein